MFVHIFSFRWHAEASESQKARAVEAIRAFAGQIPGLISVYAGTNVSPRSLGYELGGVMQFTDAASFEAYTTHALHQALLVWLVPLVDAIEIDFDAAV